MWSKDGEFKETGMLSLTGSASIPTDRHSLQRFPQAGGLCFSFDRSRNIIPRFAWKGESEERWGKPGRLCELSGRR